MTVRHHKNFINGEWLSSNERLAVHSPWDGRIVAETDQADQATFDGAIGHAHAAFQKSRKLPRHIRGTLLRAIADGILANKAEMAQLIVSEAGKPKMLAEIEVQRAISTFTIASEEARHLVGEIVPIDLDAGGAAFRDAWYNLVPTGPVLAITPFNFPLNLVAHKVAPALAIGAPVIIKPAPQTPGAAALLVKIIDDAVKASTQLAQTVPKAMVQLINAQIPAVQFAIKDPRLPIVSFTGSDVVGWQLRAQAPKKKVFLELGGNAAAIVFADANLERAAQRIAFGAFAYAGQVCISVQRVLVQDSVYEKFVPMLVGEAKKVRVGNPTEDGIVVGPMINKSATERAMQWIESAQSNGAKVILGGGMNGPCVEPTIIEGAKRDDKVRCDEAFAPIVVIERFSDRQDAWQLVNDSRFGLQAGVFSHDTRIINSAIDELEIGGLIINEVPTFRADQMPYGGVKESGSGREGLRFAMREFSEMRTVVQWQG